MTDVPSTIRVLLALVDDLTVEREEEGLLRSTLDHVVTALGKSGALTQPVPMSAVVRGHPLYPPAPGVGVLTYMSHAVRADPLPR